MWSISEANLGRRWPSDYLPSPGIIFSPSLSSALTLPPSLCYSTDLKRAGQKHRHLRRPPVWYRARQKCPRRPEQPYNHWADSQEIPWPCRLYSSRPRAPHQVYPPLPSIYPIYYSSSPFYKLDVSSHTQFKKSANLSDFISLWRPINGPIQNWPLAVCDGNTLPEDNLVLTERIRTRDKAIARFVVHSPSIKWYYQSGMEDDSLLVLKNYDSQNGVAKCTLSSDDWLCLPT